jgi:putative membrane protein
MSILKLEKNAKNDKIVNIIGIVIPIVVAILIGGVRHKIDLGAWTKTLPHVIAFMNSTTALTLILGLIFIKSKNYIAHERMMTASFLQGGVFLVLYILYHVSNESTSSALMPSPQRGIYLFLLASHIILSIGVVWFVVRAMYYSLSGQFDAHKKVVKIAFPVWLYVSVTGVIVYFMISPYYN